MRQPAISLSALAVVLITAAAGARAETQADCTARWEAAERARVVYGAGVVDGEAVAVVDEPTWHGAEYATKVGMAQTLVCAIWGPDKPAPIPIYFRSSLTNKVLGVWERSELTVE